MVKQHLQTCLAMTWTSLLHGFEIQQYLPVLQEVEPYNHRMSWVERDLKDDLVSSPVLWAGLPTTKAGHPVASNWVVDAKHMVIPPVRLFRDVNPHLYQKAHSRYSGPCGDAPNVVEHLAVNHMCSFHWKWQHGEGYKQPCPAAAFQGELELTGSWNW